MHIEMPVHQSATNVLASVLFVFGSAFESALAHAPRTHTPTGKRVWSIPSRRIHTHTHIHHTRTAYAAGCAQSIRVCVPCACAESEQKHRRERCAHVRRIGARTTRRRRRRCRRVGGGWWWWWVGKLRTDTHRSSRIVAARPRYRRHAHSVFSTQSVQAVVCVCLFVSCIFRQRIASNIQCVQTCVCACV